jgi:hypothetical protein
MFFNAHLIQEEGDRADMILLSIESVTVQVEMGKELSVHEIHEAAMERNERLLL